MLIYVCVSLCCFIMSKYASKSTCTDDVVEPRSDKVSRDYSTLAGEKTLLQNDGIKSSISSNGICVSTFIFGCLPVPQSSIARTNISHLK